MRESIKGKRGVIYLKSNYSMHIRDALATEGYRKVAQEVNKYH